MLSINFITQLSEKAYQFFGDTYTKASRQHFLKLRPFIDQFIAPLDKEREKILDIGCGPGYLLEYLKEQGFQHLLGLDISDAAIKEAAKRVPTHMLLRQDFHRISFKPQEFSVIFAINSLQYTSKKILGNVLERLHYFTKPDAKFFIVLPKGSSEQISEETYTDPVNQQKRQHVVYHSFYEKEEIKELLRQAKFSVTSLEVYQDSAFPQPLLIIAAKRA